ncbi:MAG: sensor histidine kinase [Rectinemataceae bacterium]
MTIKKRIGLSFAFMMAVPVFVMMLTGMFFRLYYFGSTFPPQALVRGMEEGQGLATSMPRHGPSPAAGLFFLVGASVFLLGANAILSWTVSRSILRPLGRLEAAAKRIKDGDLSPPPEAPSTPAQGECRKGLQNIDEFQRVEASFEEMRLRLHRSLVERVAEEDNRRELIASISHDLRTPIAAIRGYVEGLGDGVADTMEKQDRYLAIIRSKAVLMNRLVDDLALFSGLETSAVVLDRKAHDFTAFLGEVLAELAFDFPELRIELDAPLPCHLDFDAVQLKRVIANIVQNAARHAGPCALRVTERLNEGMVKILFADDGPGIRSEDLPLVFERFYRADKARNMDGGGHGLGLSIARMIVEAHGGMIRAESRAGEGASFVIELPIPDPPTASVDPPTRLPQPREA